MSCRVPRSVPAFLVVYMTTDKSSFLHHRRSFAIYSDMSPPSSSMTLSSLNNISRERKVLNQYYYVKWGLNVWVLCKNNWKGEKPLYGSFFMNMYSMRKGRHTIKVLMSHICRQTKNIMWLFTKYLTIGKNDQKILNKNGTFIRAIMSYVNILVSTPSPASIPLPTVVSSLATAKKHSLHIKGGGASIQLR